MCDSSCRVLLLRLIHVLVFVVAGTTKAAERRASALREGGTRGTAVVGQVDSIQWLLTTVQASIGKSCRIAKALGSVDSIEHGLPRANANVRSNSTQNCIVP